MTGEAKKIVQALRCDGFESHCDGCDYYTYEVDGKLFCDSDKAYIDAADLIERMDAELERLMRERDAAVYDLAINRSCAVCMNERGFKCAAHGCAHENEWQWRGVCKENSNAEN